MSNISKLQDKAKEDFINNENYSKKIIDLNKTIEQKFFSSESELKQMSLIELSKVLPAITKSFIQLQNQQLELNNEKYNSNQQLFNLSKKLLGNKKINNKIQELIKLISKEF